jgi:hypothetical protein
MTISDSYDQILIERPDVSLAVAAVKALTQTIRTDTSTTTAEFLSTIETNADWNQFSKHRYYSPSISSSDGLFGFLLLNESKVEYTS